MFIIAEVGQAADGSLGMMHSYIDALKNSNIDAIKFQTHIADAESSVYEPFRVKFSKQDKTRFDYWKRMEFTLEQWKGLKEHCDSVGLEFISSPFSIAAVELLEELGVKRYKIGSGEVSNLLMLDRIARTGKQILLSSGMSGYSEIEKAIKAINNYHNDIVVFQCTSNYPVRPDAYGINVCKELFQQFKLPVGYSDHSGSMFPPIAALCHGASYFESHVIFDKRMFGPDVSSSLTIDEFKMMSKALRELKIALDSPINKNNIDSFSEMKKIFQKSLAVNKKLQPGHCLKLEDLEAKKPYGRGIPAEHYDKVLGKQLKFTKEKWDFLLETDF